MSPPVKQISHYEIISELGRGGMGVVYEAIDTRLDRHVAVKVIEIPNDPSLSENSKAELIERFKREAKASAKLNHPNIVSIFDFGEQDGRYYMVMEILRGRNLSQLLQISSPLSLQVSLKALIQVSRALDFAHQKGIIHRDIKPANIVILDNGIAKLADFGIARLEATNSNLTQAGSILGSLLYISPEQLMNPQNVDKRTDIYSLGVTAYEILTGQLPYNGSNIGEIVMKIMQSEPLLPSMLNPQLPPELDQVIFRSMGKTPASRYSTAEEMANALNQVLMKITGGAGDLSSVTRDYPSSTGDLSDAQKVITAGNSIQKISTVFGTEHLNTTALSSDEFTLVEGIDDATLYSAVYRVIQNWNLENLTTNTLLEAIYKNEGKSQALVINNSVILLLYKGLLLGAVVRQPELLGSQAYQYMASWQKFDMKQCLPLEKDEPLVVLLAVILGASRVNEKHPICSRDDMLNILEAQKRAGFTGVIKVLERKKLKWHCFMDGIRAFTITMPYPSGLSDGEFYDVEILTPRFNLVGPSLRKILGESQLQVVSKSVNRPTLSQFAGPKEKNLTPEILEEALRNTDLTVILSEDHTFQIGKRPLKYSEVFRETNHYKLIDWLTYEFMYGMSRTGKFQSLKKRFSWVWQIKSMKFLQPLKVSGSSMTFDLLGYSGQEQINLLARFESNVTGTQITQFVEDIKKIKLDKDVEEIKAGVLVSLSPIPPAAITYFNAITTKPLDMSLLDFSNTAKGYVRINWKKGFLLFLVTLTDDTFSLSAPVL